MGGESQNFDDTLNIQAFRHFVFVLETSNILKARIVCFEYFEDNWLSIGLCCTAINNRVSTFVDDLG